VKKCILFSGGWDSVAAALMETDADLLFFSYGQIYLEKELKKAQEFSNAHQRNLHVHTMSLSHDIERRNFYFILEAKKLGFQHIVTGNRNVVPLFDMYKDSNAMYLKILCFMSNLKITLPVLMWGKRRIVKFVLTNTDVVPYNCYKNNDDYKTCTCSNCEELKGVFKCL
jgi:7-cyano-7-deazaguanine synthase in queuosine biosynthesis